MGTVGATTKWLRSVGTRAKGFWHLPLRDKRAFIRAITALPLVRLGLRVKGLNTVQRWLDPGRPRARPESDDAIDEARRLGRVVHLAAQHAVGESKCLPRSLVLWSLLRRSGCDAQLRIGVGGKQDGGPLFHAWVESAGTVVNDAPDVAERYLPFQGSIEPRQTSF